MFVLNKEKNDKGKRTTTEGIELFNQNTRRKSKLQIFKNTFFKKNKNEGKNEKVLLKDKETCENQILKQRNL